MAIELAAARCRQISPERISTELDDRFRLLTGGARTLLVRQQTLTSSVEWSFDLLDDVERMVFWRLGVFVGQFSLEAAEAVVAAVGNLDAAEVFDGSLVVADDDVASPYRLLETLRAFAVSRCTRPQQSPGGDMSVARMALSGSPRGRPFGCISARPRSRCTGQRTRPACRRARRSTAVMACCPLECCV